jgi:hypothetical protein
MYKHVCASSAVGDGNGGTKLLFLALSAFEGAL